MTPDLRALLDQQNAPVVYWHDKDNEPPTVAIVDPQWLSDIWQAAIAGGYEDPDWNDAAREAHFVDHGHHTNTTLAGSWIRRITIGTLAAVALGIALGIGHATTPVVLCGAIATVSLVVSYYFAIRARRLLTTTERDRHQHQHRTKDQPNQH